jgi:PilZ domain
MNMDRNKGNSSGVGETRESICVRVLLVCRDIQVIETFCRFAQAMSIHVELSCDVESAMRKLCHGKFEGVIVDLEVDGGHELLPKIRTLTSNKSVLSFAILQQHYQRGDSFPSTASFVLERPLLSAVVLRVLKASYPMMVRERRRYFRCPLQISVFVTREGEPEFAVTSLNLSEAGICLNSSTPIKVGDRLRLRLCLPGDTEFLNLAGVVCWSEALGRLGVQFSGLTDKVAQSLRSWLAERLEQTLATNPRAILSAAESTSKS